MQPTGNEDQHYKLAIIDDRAGAINFFDIFHFMSHRTLNAVCLFDASGNGGLKTIEAQAVEPFQALTTIEQNKLNDPTYYAGFRLSFLARPNEIAFVDERYLLIAGPVLEALKEVMSDNERFLRALLAPHNSVGLNRAAIDSGVPERINTQTGEMQKVLQLMHRHERISDRTVMLDEKYGPDLLEIYRTMVGNVVRGPILVV